MLSKPKTCWGQLKSLKVWFIGELVKNPTVGKNPKISKGSLGLVDNPYICSCGLSSIKLVSMLAGIILDSNSPRALKLFNSLCYSPEHMVPLTHIQYPVYPLYGAFDIHPTKLTMSNQGDIQAEGGRYCRLWQSEGDARQVWFYLNHSSQQSQSYFS